MNKIAQNVILANLPKMNWKRFLTSKHITMGSVIYTGRMGL